MCINVNIYRAQERGGGAWIYTGARGRRTAVYPRYYVQHRNCRLIIPISIKHTTYK